MKIVTTSPSFQGELMVMRIAEIPAGVKVVASTGDKHIIGHSETGHHHVIEAGQAEIYEPADDAFCAYVRSLGKGADLVHERAFDTHEALHLPPGNYVVRRQRQATPDGWERVVD